MLVYNTDHNFLHFVRITSQFKFFAEMRRFMSHVTLGHGSDARIGQARSFPWLPYYFSNKRPSASYTKKKNRCDQGARDHV